MTENDTVTELLGATIQHGKLNDRIYLMSLREAEPTHLIPAMKSLANAEGYTKIFAKVPASKAAPFYDAGFRREAEVAGFFNGREDAVFVCAYLDEERRVSPVQKEIDAVASHATHVERIALAPLTGVTLRQATEADIPQMAALYRTVFRSYPFPIHDPGYLRETMTSHVDYFLVEENKTVAALSSAEMDLDNRNVEMTDFATHEAYRGRRLAVHLLAHMEQAMKARGMACAYTIARAISYPMNLTFARLGYDHGGLLTNNTNISGQIETMAVWHKRL